jgi:hypothetical protein
MSVGYGPKSLSFEDRVLYHVVSLTTSDRPVPPGSGVSEADIAEQLAEELGVSSEFIRSGSFHSSDVRGTVREAFTTLEKRGLVDARKVLGPWMVRPTSEGRERFMRWQDSSNRLGWFSGVCSSNSLHSGGPTHSITKSHSR